jgi:hypothetical protein
MGKQFETLTQEHIAFIREQHLFFAGTAAATGHVNISPKGMDSLRVLSPDRILWVNLTGSGNESAAHVAQDPRMTMMWCSFGLRPMILRAYGTARVLHRNSPDWDDLAQHIPNLPGLRQLVDVRIELVQSSCGFAVPFMEFTAERPVLKTWAEDKGEAGLRAYWETRNQTSLDGFPTGIEANL